MPLTLQLLPLMKLCGNVSWLREVAGKGKENLFKMQPASKTEQLIVSEPLSLRNKAFIEPVLMLELNRGVYF